MRRVDVKIRHLIIIVAMGVLEVVRPHLIKESLIAGIAWQAEPFDHPALQLSIMFGFVDEVFRIVEWLIAISLADIVFVEEAIQRAVLVMTLRTREQTHLGNPTGKRTFVKLEARARSSSVSLISVDL